MLIRLLRGYIVVKRRWARRLAVRFGRRLFMLCVLRLRLVALRRCIGGRLRELTACRECVVCRILCLMRLAVGVGARGRRTFGTRWRLGLTLMF